MTSQARESDSTPKLPALLPLDDALAMIHTDHAEGKEDVTLTRASARALYYAVWDALYAGKPREYSPEDLHRLQLELSTLGRAGWPS